MKFVSSESYYLDPAIRVVDIGQNERLAGRSTGLVYNLRRIFLLRSQLRECGADVLITMMVKANVVGILATMFSDIKCVASERNHPAQYYLGGSWSLLRNKLYAAAHCIVAQTDSVAEWLVNNTSATNIEVIANPLELPLRSFEPNVPVPKIQSGLIVGVGRLSAQKQFDHLIRVFANVAAEYGNWRLAIIGEGADANELLRLAHELGVADKVILPGRVGNVGDWYEKADIFVMTSKYEGYPNALIEAMGYGLPVVSYNCPSGPSEVIEPDRNGFLIDQDDREQMTEAVRQLMGDSQLARRMGKNAALIAKPLRADRIVDKWLQTIGKSPQ